MSNIKSLHLVVALSIAMPLGISDAMAFNSKKKPEKLTYEQAYAKCKAQLDWTYKAGESQRYTRGSACMHAATTVIVTGGESRCRSFWNFPTTHPCRR